MSALDKLKAKTEWTIYKFKDPDGKIYRLLRAGADPNELKPYATEKFEGNVLLNEGIQLLIEIITGIDTTSNKWDSSNAHIGVGDSNASEDASQTGLQGSNKAFKGMDSGYPTRSGNTAIWRATFGGDEANFHWYEFTVVNGTDDSATNLNRKVVDKGTKASGETWTVQLEITFS